MELPDVYSRLLKSFGPQGWWPSEGGFRPRELEVCIGAILTQNTSWRNVEKALDGLRKECRTAEDLASMDTRRLESLVRPSGYYRQKAGRLKGFARFVLDYGGMGRFLKNVTREELLSIKGVGPETADSILLYACGKPWFVVDLYTKRVFSRMGLISSDDYHKVQDYFMSSIRKDVKAYREFHALIVELAKRHCMKRPSCEGCPLESGCRKML
jgi:endonuclease-3 related protein